jgi:hypothetical protein
MPTCPSLRSRVAERVFAHGPPPQAWARACEHGGDARREDEGAGRFAALCGLPSSAKWAPSGDVVYSLDYDRGIDIIRWKSSHYVPTGHGRDVRRERGRIRGTNGVSPLPVLSGAALARHTALAQQLSAAGWSPGYCRLAALA